MHHLTPALGAAALTLCLAGSVQGGEVSAYICAVDNCAKRYLDSSQAVAEACRDGVHNAGKKPSSPECLKLCDASYGAKGESLVTACKKGCSLFPDACLRDGSVAPEDPKMRRPRTERYTAPPARPSQRNQDRYRRWW
jgi:hypothetical protein